MTRLVWSIALFLLLLGGAALAEDLSKINGYAVTFSVANSPAENIAKINAYAVVTVGLAPTPPALGSGAFGAISLGIN